MREFLKDGQRVYYDIGNEVHGEGTIVGLSMDHVIRFYIVQSDVIHDPQMYNYRCFVIAESLLRPI